MPRWSPPRTPAGAPTRSRCGRRTPCCTALPSQQTGSRRTTACTSTTTRAPGTDTGARHGAGRSGLGRGGFLEGGVARQHALDARHPEDPGHVRGHAGEAELAPHLLAALDRGEEHGDDRRVEEVET